MIRRISNIPKSKSLLAQVCVCGESFGHQTPDNIRAVTAISDACIRTDGSTVQLTTVEFGFGWIGAVSINVLQYAAFLDMFLTQVMLVVFDRDSCSVCSSVWQPCLAVSCTGVHRAMETRQRRYFC